MNKNDIKDNHMNKNDIKVLIEMLLEVERMRDYDKVKEAEKPDPEEGECTVEEIMGVTIDKVNQNIEHVNALKNLVRKLKSQVEDQRDHINSVEERFSRHIKDIYNLLNNQDTVNSELHKRIDGLQNRFNNQDDINDFVRVRRDNMEE